MEKWESMWLIHPSFTAFFGASFLLKFDLGLQYLDRTLFYYHIPPYMGCSLSPL